VTKNIVNDPVVIYSYFFILILFYFHDMFWLKIKFILLRICWRYTCVVWKLKMLKSGNLYRGRRGHDHMVVGLTTTYAISAYHH